MDYKYNKPYSTGWNGVKSKYEITPDYSRPLPPRNTFVTNPYILGALDIRWDSPSDISENSNFHILGVNIYRSDDSECGPYYKINKDPMGTLYFRDHTTHKLVADEDVMPRLSPGTNPRGDWYFKTLNKPLVKEGSQNTLVTDPHDIVVKVDNGDGKGALVVPALKINAREGEVYLIRTPIYNPETKKYEDPRLPIGPEGKCYVSYWYNTNFIKHDLIPRFFYKVATVGRDKSGNILETDLNNITPSNVYQIEKPHYIWKAIIVKNRYLLEQLGERVKLFIRKEVGEKCPLYTDSHGQSHYHCKLCYGTGVLGGYYGPFDIMIAGPEAAKNIELTDIGFKMSFTFESWMGPSPLIRSRDFIVRQNGERLSIGSVTPQGAKGSVFQQHFTLNYRDTKDIIYQVPFLGNTPQDCANVAQVPLADDTRGVNQPIRNDSPVIPDYKSERAKTDKGRTIDYENVTW